MDQIAVVTGADRGLGLALTDRLLSQGWRVYAGQYMPDWPELGQMASRHPNHLTIVPLDVASADSAHAAAQAVAEAADHVDLLINNAGVSSRTSARDIREVQDYGEMHRMYDVNALGPLRVVEAFMPLLDRGEMKRLCFVSSEAGSINNAQRTSWFGYCSSKASLNMIVKLLFNHLRPDGYSFRVYHPGWMRTYMSGSKNPRADMEPEEAAAAALAYFLANLADEGRLVLRDWRGREWPW
jgi:NAD(P)-dependent dehydrogenase (short-subunit alcohol dehydrogenase family)